MFCPEGDRWSYYRDASKPDSTPGTSGTTNCPDPTKGGMLAPRGATTLDADTDRWSVSWLGLDLRWF